MTENSALKLARIIDKFYSVYEKGCKNNFLLNKIKWNQNIYCYSKQIPDIFVYYNNNFNRKDCFYQFKKNLKTTKIYKIVEVELKEEKKPEV